MMERIVSVIIETHFSMSPDLLRRFSTGYGNYVYYAEIASVPYVIRISENDYENTIHYLTLLKEAEIPVQEIIAAGQIDKYHYLLLSYLEGEELNQCYTSLSQLDKRTIAREVAAIQKKLASLNTGTYQAWPLWVRDMLSRAKSRILQNGVFNPAKVDYVSEQAEGLKDYFASLTPVPYLDDITTKNLLVKGGHVSGIIDVDWLERGDPLTFAALTYVALRNMDCDTDYVTFLLEEMKITESQETAFWFYALLYCVDFMGERGCTFNGRTVQVDEETINRLNRLFDEIRLK